MEIEINNTSYWLVKFHFMDIFCHRVLYTFLVGKETCYPLLKGKKVLFFREEIIKSYLVKNTITVEEAIELDIDISSAINTLKYRCVDTDSNVLSYLNILFDIIKFTGNNQKFKKQLKVLYPLADHLTFDTEFYKNYALKKHKDRNQICDAFCTLQNFFINTIYRDSFDVNIELLLYLIYQECLS